MECIESSVGLSRMYKVRVPAADLQQRLTAKIEEMRPRMNIKGFRPGKVPAAHVRRMFGRSIMGEVVEAVVQESSSQAIAEANVRPAGQPEMHMESDMEAVLDGKADLSYHMHLDIMPEFEPLDVATLTVKRPVVEISDAILDERLGKIAEANLKYEPRKATAKAKSGDALLIDFLGRIDGVAFEGGSAEGHTLILGSNSFIPGFEDLLIGVKTGETKDVSVTFPADYQAAHLAGKEAVFGVTVHEVKAPQTPEIDEEFAKGLGVESLDKLKDLVRDQIQREFARAARDKAKRNLLDQLDTAHSFDLPPKMLEAEFERIWRQLQSETEAGRVAEEDKDKSEEELRAEYRKIAERRVRLGLVLAEIGRKAGVTIDEHEVNQALIAEARNFPGQEREVIEFFQKNPGAMAQVRAPIYEEKVVDHILSLVTIEEETTTREALLAEESA